MKKLASDLFHEGGTASVPHWANLPSTTPDWRLILFWGHITPPGRKKVSNQVFNHRNAAETSSPPPPLLFEKQLLRPPAPMEKWVGLPTVKPLHRRHGHQYDWNHCSPCQCETMKEHPKAWSYWPDSGTALIRSHLNAVRCDKRSFLGLFWFLHFKRQPHHVWKRRMSYTYFVVKYSMEMYLEYFFDPYCCWFILKHNLFFLMHSLLLRYS